MSSRLQSRGRVESRSGGKILRGRRVLPLVSPYSRPSSAETLLPLRVLETQAGRNPSWIRGLISGAGKVFSFVLGSGSNESYSSDSSSEYSSDEDHDPSPNELEDHSTGFNVRETVAEGNVKSLAIVPKSETKHVIEHLLMQETYSREECNKLIQIILSRVINQSAKTGGGSLSEVPYRTTGDGLWQSLNQNMDLSGTSNHFLSNLACSPGIYSREAVSCDLRKKAVMEAKKWFGEKQLSPTRTYNQECGVCILSPDTSKYGFDTGGGSPIDMAKSYMQSLPPWRSPYFSTVGFMTPPSSEEHSSHYIRSQMLPTSKAIERDYLAIGHWDLQSLENDQERSKLRQAELTARFSACEASKRLEEKTDIKTGQDATKGVHCSGKLLKLHDGKAIEVDNAMEIDNITSEIVTLEPKQAFKSAENAEIVAALTTTLEPLHSNIGSKLNPTDAMDMSYKNQDLEVHLLSEEQACSISCQDSPILVSTGDCIRESEILLHKNVTLAEPSLQKKSGDTGKFAVNISLRGSPESDCKQSHSVTDSRPPNENPHDQEATASARKIDANGHLSEVNNINSDLESMNKGDPTTTNSSKAGAPVMISQGTHEPPSDVSSDIPSTHRTASTTSRLRKGMKTRSTEQISQPPEPSRHGNRRAKMTKVVRPKRGRG